MPLGTGSESISCHSIISKITNIQWFVLYFFKCTCKNVSWLKFSLSSPKLRYNLRLQSVHDHVFTDVNVRCFSKVYDRHNSWCSPIHISFCQKDVSKIQQYSIIFMSSIFSSPESKSWFSLLCNCEEENEVAKLLFSSVCLF